MFNNIKAEMARLNISSVQMAKRLGISRNTFSAKLNGKQEFTLAEIEKLLGCFPNVNFDYLFTRKKAN